MLHDLRVLWLGQPSMGQSRETTVSLRLGQSSRANKTSVKAPIQSLPFAEAPTFSPGLRLPVRLTTEPTTNEHTVALQT